MRKCLRCILDCPLEVTGYREARKPKKKKVREVKKIEFIREKQNKDKAMKNRNDTYTKEQV